MAKVFLSSTSNYGERLGGSDKSFTELEHEKAVELILPLAATNDEAKRMTANAKPDT